MIFFTFNVLENNLVKFLGLSCCHVKIGPKDRRFGDVGQPGFPGFPGGLP